MRAVVVKNRRKHRKNHTLKYFVLLKILKLKNLETNGIVSYSYLIYLYQCGNQNVFKIKKETFLQIKTQNLIHMRS